jgi:hypothetical protein
VTRVVAKPADELAAGQILDDKEGLNQLGDGERRLGDQVAQVGRLPEPQPRPARRE